MGEESMLILVHDMEGTNTKQPKKQIEELIFRHSLLLQQSQHIVYIAHGYLW